MRMVRAQDPKAPLESHATQCSRCNKQRPLSLTLSKCICAATRPTLQGRMGGETFNSRRAALKHQTTVEWDRTVENLTRALKEQAAAARASAWSKTIEKLRHRQMALKEQTVTARTADGKFGPVWNAQSPKRSTRGGDLVLSE
jgi:hypothetical protein